MRGKKFEDLFCFHLGQVLQAKYSLCNPKYKYVVDGLVDKEYRIVRIVCVDTGAIIDSAGIDALEPWRDND